MIDDIGLLTSYLLAQGTLTAQTSACQRWLHACSGWGRGV